MKIGFLFSCFLLSLTQLQSAPKSEDYTPLFNGKNLTGWHATYAQLNAPSSDPKAQPEPSPAESQAAWQVKDGEVVSRGGSVCASTEADYGDFELTLEYKVSPGARSGLYLRGNPEIQIWDTTRKGGHWPYGAAKGSGGLWSDGFEAPGSDPLVHADKPTGEWNQMRVRLIGSRAWVWVNDQLVVKAAPMRDFQSRGTRPLPTHGPISLHTRAGETHWRALQIRAIEADEANQVLDQIDDEGFEPLFNGQDFTGWQGGFGGYNIQDGAIVSKSNSYLFTKEKYRNFIFKFEFKLPPGGNNGLAIRYPGKGTSSAVGMTELQILDNTAEKYADLLPGQYHGSAYKKAPALRGYLRPVGTWNYQIVHVQGNRIKVELNGNRILDADLSTVTYGGNPHDGFLGFAGHGPNIAFKNLKLRTLDSKL